jgi:hypothetical protein
MATGMAIGMATGMASGIATGGDGGGPEGGVGEGPDGGVGEGPEGGVGEQEAGIVSVAQFVHLAAHPDPHDGMAWRLALQRFAGTLGGSEVMLHRESWFLSTRNICKLLNEEIEAGIVPSRELFFSQSSERNVREPMEAGI